jgi:hypothetical protein
MLSGEPPQIGESPADGRFNPPVFERFTDMENFIRTDPIHDVGDAGWLHARTGDTPHST